ncbi:MAG TPA: phosphoribosylformylglycinamidine synthase subunit PurS [Deltaproteobacteria bacterium]|nr:phosphoribosylformylglycinamidine synthase subunit PurS [Deltaproteobacteria bacterium]
MRFNVYVTLKRGVLDPQGRAVMEALHSLHFSEVRDVRVGKFIELDLNGMPEEEAKARVEKMCQELLANPVIEEFRIEEVTE